MAEQGPSDATLSTLHEDLRGVREDVTGVREELRGGFAEMRASFADLKSTMVTGFRGLPTRESAEEVVRLLREGNRLQEERFTRLDVRIREQHLETQQVQRALVDGQRQLVEGQNALSADIRALIARLDALIRGRGDGGVAS